LTARARPTFTKQLFGGAAVALVVVAIAGGAMKQSPAKATTTGDGIHPVTWFLRNQCAGMVPAGINGVLAYVGWLNTQSIRLGIGIDQFETMTATQAEAEHPGVLARCAKHYP
jgi:hypothetical protein